MILFYIFQGFHWWANFELGIHNSTTSTYYNLIIFASAAFVIAIMLILGARVNKQKHTHEFYLEKISEENQRQRDEREKKQNKEAQAAKTAMWVKVSPKIIQTFFIFFWFYIRSWNNFYTLRKGFDEKRWVYPYFLELMKKIKLQKYYEKI